MKAHTHTQRKSTLQKQNIWQFKLSGKQISKRNKNEKKLLRKKIKY